MSNTNTVSAPLTINRKGEAYAKARLAKAEAFIAASSSRQRECDALHNAEYWRMVRLTAFLEKALGRPRA